MARARLRDRHQDNLRRKLQVLKAEQAVALPPTVQQRELNNTLQSEESLLQSKDYVEEQQFAPTSSTTQDKSENNTSDDEK